MKQRIQLALCAAAAVLSLSAQAGSGVMASEVPRITNGGTGVHTLPASDGMPSQAWRAPQDGVATTPAQAGEASTMVQGRPNAHPAMATGMHTPQETRAMGNARWGMGAGPAPAMHPAWGTPD